MATQSQLVSGPITGRTLTYFGLGGTGIRVLEPLLHLCALGLGPRRLHVVLIDPDQSNAAVAKSRKLLDLYRQTRDALNEGRAIGDGYFRTEVIDVLGQKVLWSPIAEDDGGTAVFSARIGKALLTGPALPLRRMFDLLYSDETQSMDLTLGFRGVPSIGTVFMNRLRNEPFFRQVLSDARTDAESVFFAAGSIFGGTGAAGLPVVGRALIDGIADSESPMQGIEPRRVGAALLLPYFTLPTPESTTAPDGGIRPEAALFAQNAAAALPTYTSAQAGFSSYYVLGDDQPREQPENAVGGGGQDNPSHYVELFAALAALDFAARGGEQNHTSAQPSFVGTAVRGKEVRWDDLPIDAASKQRLMGGMVAVHTFLTHFRPDGLSHPGIARALNGSTWIDTLGMRMTDLERNSDALDLLGKFFLETWHWLANLRGSNPPLELVPADKRAPSTLLLDRTIEGHRPTRKLSRTVPNGFEPFRHWNMAAHQMRDRGYGGFLDVMRQGSEGFAAERFSETVNV